MASQPASRPAAPSQVSTQPAAGLTIRAALSGRLAAPAIVVPSMLAGDAPPPERYAVDRLLVDAVDARYRQRKRQLVVVPVGDALCLDREADRQQRVAAALAAFLIGEVQRVVDLARQLVHVAFARQRLEQPAILHALQVRVRG